MVQLICKHKTYSLNTEPALPPIEYGITVTEDCSHDQIGVTVCDFKLMIRMECHGETTNTQEK